MAPNKHEEKGRQMRREGKPKPTVDRENWYTTKQHVRNSVDVVNGYTKEDEERANKAKKK